MTNFMSCNNDSTEAASILDDGDTVDLLQSLIYNASSTNIGKSFNLELITIKWWFDCKTN